MLHAVQIAYHIYKFSHATYILNVWVILEILETKGIVIGHTHNQEDLYVKMATRER